MSIQVKFRVHGVNASTTTARAKVEGELLMATVPCVEVELVSEAERHGNMTLRFTGSGMADAQGLFVKDRELVATFEEYAAP